MESPSRRAAIHKIVELSQAPHEGAFLVTGEPGIGKSHLIDEAHALVESSVMVVQANRAESTLSLSGISDLISALHGKQTVELGGQFSLRSRAPERMFAAAHDLLSLIRGFHLKPTLVVIDDVDLMDADSQMLIGLMANRLVGTNVRLVASATTIDQDNQLSGVSTTHLTPFSTSDMNAMAADLVPAGDEVCLRIIVERCGGNPRILQEHLHDIDAEVLSGNGWLTLPPRSTDTTDAIVTPMLRNLSPTARELLETIALAPLCHASVIAGRGDAADDDAEDLIDVGLLRSDGPYLLVADPRVRNYCYWRTSARARRERHAELAVTTAEHSEHLAAWHRSFDGHDATAELLAGAAGLADLGQVEAAIELAERALRKSDRIEDHLPAISDLATALLLRSEAPLAARYTSRARSASAPTEHATRLAILTVAANAMHHQGVADEEVKALVALHSGTDPVGAATLVALAAYMRAERWEAEEAKALLAATANIRDQLDEVAIERLKHVQIALDALLGGPSSEEQTPLEIAIDSPRKSAPSLLLLHGRALSYREEYAQARHVLTLVVNHPQSVDRVWEDLARYAQVGNEMRAGQFRMARDVMASWRQGSPWTRRRSSRRAFLLAWYDYSLGRLDSAEAALEQCVKLATTEDFPAARATALALRGTIALQSGDHETAVGHLRLVTAFSSKFRNPSLLRHWTDYIEACLLTDRTKEASSAFKALKLRNTRHASRWGELAARRCHALMTPGEASLALFQAAVDEFADDESPYEKGRTLLAFAGRQDLLGLDVEARRTRASAIASFDSAGAAGWALTSAPATAEDHPILQTLNDEEREIVRCVLAGMRNREIATALYVSVRTVEARLTHVYRALGVQSRSQLMAQYGTSRARSS